MREPGTLLALNGVRAAEDAAAPGDLARKLEEFFRPVAPLLRVFPASAVPKLDLGSGTSNTPGGTLPVPFLADLAF